MFRTPCLLLVLLVSGLRSDGWQRQIYGDSILKETGVDSLYTQNLRERYNYPHEMDGEMAKAFITAYLGFQINSEIPQSKREVNNYTIKMKKDKDRFRILFSAKRTKNSSGKGGETELGKDVEYTVSSTDYKIISRAYFK